MYKRVMIYSDGGARGNPGPAAIAFRVLSESGEFVKAESGFIGVRTNNQTEYEALIMALEFAITLNAEEIVCHLDSELVTKQLNREYRVKNFDLLKLWNKVQAMKSNFKKITFKHVPRTNMEIQKVDALVNKTLDLEDSVNYKGL